MAPVAILLGMAPQHQVRKFQRPLGAKKPDGVHPRLREFRILAKRHFPCPGGWRSVRKKKASHGLIGEFQADGNRILLLELLIMMRDLG